jgi:hypothetical protein
MQVRARFSTANPQLLEDATIVSPPYRTLTLGNVASVPPSSRQRQYRNFQSPKPVWHDRYTTEYRNQKGKSQVSLRFGG